MSHYNKAFLITHNEALHSLINALPTGFRQHVPFSCWVGFCSTFRNVLRYQNLVKFLAWNTICNLEKTGAFGTGLWFVWTGYLPIIKNGPKSYNRWCVIWCMAPVVTWLHQRKLTQSTWWCHCVIVCMTFVPFFTPRWRRSCQAKIWTWRSGLLWRLAVNAGTVFSTPEGKQYMERASTVGSKNS